MPASALSLTPAVPRRKVETASEMLRCTSAAPCPQLRQYVRAYAQREMDRAPLDIMLPAQAELEPILELDFANPVHVEHGGMRFEGVSHISLAGPRTWRKFEVRLRGPVNSFGIFFQPLGLRQLFGVPCPLLVNTGFSGPDVLGSGISQLWERMAQTDSFAERATLADAYLLKAAGNASAPTAVMDSARHLFQRSGALRVDALAGYAGLSVRHYERRFLDEIGIAPKLFARVARFQAALDMKLASPGLSWLAIAHEFGYHDQMHMIRDFRVFASDTPGGILPQLGDMRPEALLPDKT
jgi:AraC-like DNA-binding protein